MRSMQIGRLALSFCHGSEGKSCREELRAIILPKERLIYAKEEGEEERKEHSLTTKIYNGLHCKGESNTITQIHCYSPAHTGRVFYICAGNSERRSDTHLHSLLCLSPHIDRLLRG
ncbi:hypothetical protein FQN60_013841 [Etheostoma spectabile]|uniref:Uncharacterized protein n=1 Tax=Etheostoma spectabile TaxID=54343 RepID=A0A5J5CJI1_9PERO|nr:hypothetical protein FQN60_013841 [Etheostoma spectabile]